MPSDTDAGSLNENRVGKTCCPASHTGSERTPCDSVPRTAATSRKWRHLLSKHYHRSWIMGLWLRSWDKKQMSLQWKTPSSPRPKKARQVRSNVKTMLIAFIDAEGLVHQEFLPQRQTMNQTVNINVLQRLRDAVRRKQPHTWSSGTWLLHQDKAPCHAALSVREFLVKHSIPVVSNLSY
jgi:hypothetical protein